MTRKLDMYWHVRKAEGLMLVQSRKEMARWEHNQCSDTDDGISFTRMHGEERQCTEADLQEI